MELTDEQAQQIIKGMDMVLETVSGITVTQLIEQQRGLVSNLTEEQQVMFMNTLAKQTADLLASSISMTTSEYKKSLDLAGGKK
jgi:3-hydroxyisobutyrate dehydrogenase-like beta-hydroxyacid dehydrogenase